MCKVSTEHVHNTQHPRNEHLRVNRARARFAIHCNRLLIYCFVFILGNCEILSWCSVYLTDCYRNVLGRGDMFAVPSYDTHKLKWRLTELEDHHHRCLRLVNCKYNIRSYHSNIRK